MSYQTFKADGIPEKRLVPHNVPLTIFASSSFNTKGHINVDLQVGLLRAPTKFYVIEADVSYHILLGRPWIHRNYAIPSTLHQCLKAIKGRKEILISGTEALCFQEEVHWVEATFFDDICNESIESRPRGVSLTSKEDTGMEIDIIEQEKPVIERVILTNGRKIYKLMKVLRRFCEVRNDLAITEEKIKPTEVEMIEALPLTPEKLENERKNPPERLKKINLGEDKEEKVTLIAKGLTKDFEEI